MRAKDVWPTFKATFQHWSDDKVPRLAAALAYYTVFSIAPLLVIVMAIAGLVFGGKAAQGQIAGQIQQVVGPTSAAAIQEMLAHARKPSSGIVAAVIGGITLLMGAGGVFGQLQDALNTIWGVMPRPGRPFWATLRDRFMSFAMVLGTGFLLMVSLVVSAAVSAIATYFSNRLPGLPWLWEAINTVVSLVLFTVLFMMIFRVLPDVKIEWRDVWIGGLMTAALFSIGKLLIGLYLGHSGISSTYGAVGSLVVLLLWIYYSAQILLFGAEFTQVYAARFGSRIVPAENAVPITSEARAEQGMRPDSAPKPVSARPAAARAANPVYAAPAGPAGTIGPKPFAEEVGPAIRAGSLIGAAIGVVVGFLRPAARRRAH